MKPHYRKHLNVMLPCFVVLAIMLSLVATRRNCTARSKREVIIYDYVDMRVPVLARMAAKRRIGYQAIGYKILGTRDLFSGRVLASNLLAEATR